MVVPARSLICRPSHFPVSRCCHCYYFHGRQEAALSRPIASLPAPYQAAAGCLSWSGDRPNRSQDLLTRARDGERAGKRPRECACGGSVYVCVLGSGQIPDWVGWLSWGWVTSSLMTSGFGFTFTSYLLQQSGQRPSITGLCERATIRC